MVLEVGSVRTSQHISERKMKSNIIHSPPFNHRIDENKAGFLKSDYSLHIKS